MKTSKKIFIASSSEAMIYEKEIRIAIEEFGFFDPISWQEVFMPGEFGLESLLRIKNEIDVALLILSPDDKIWYRGSQNYSPRDNTIFELGFFIAALGKSNVSVIVIRDSLGNIPKIPSNIIGLNYLLFEQNKNAKNKVMINSWLSSLNNGIQRKSNDNRLSNNNSEIPRTTAFKYEIGLSYAGEDRDYVRQVAETLVNNNITVFYDQYLKSSLWGKDLYERLNNVYKNQCRYCIVFVSKHYANKLWTKHELKAAQTRAFKENKEYILPVKFDDTDIPGINDTTGYLNAKTNTPLQIAKLAIEKLNKKES